MAWVKCLVGRRSGHASYVAVLPFSGAPVAVVTVSPVRDYGNYPHVKCSLLFGDIHTVAVELKDMAGTYPRVLVHRGDVVEYLPDEDETCPTTT
jgi:hypothetical protein